MKVAHPLNELPKNGSPKTFTLDGEQNEAFDKLIDHL